MLEFLKDVAVGQPTPENPEDIGTEKLARQVLASHKARNISALLAVGAVGATAFFSAESLWTLVSGFFEGKNLFSWDLAKLPALGVGSILLSQTPAFYMNERTMHTARLEDTPLSREVKTAAKVRNIKRGFELAAIVGAPFMWPGGVSGPAWEAATLTPAGVLRMVEGHVNGHAIDKAHRRLGNVKKF